MLKTTKLHWGHFEHDHWVWTVMFKNSENIIIMGNQTAPGIYNVICNNGTYSISCYFLFAKKCHSVFLVVKSTWKWDACLVSGQLCLHSQTRWRLNDGHVVQNPQRNWFFKMHDFLNDFFLCKMNENLDIFLKFSLLFHFHNCPNILHSKISSKSIYM